MLQEVGKARIMMQVCCFACFGIIFWMGGLYTLRKTMDTTYIKKRGTITDAECLKQTSISNGRRNTEYSCRMTVKMDTCGSGSGDASGDASSGAPPCYFIDEKEIEQRKTGHVNRRVTYDYPEDDPDDKEIGDRKKEGYATGGMFSMLGFCMLACAASICMMRNNKTAQTVAGVGAGLEVADAIF